jgi:hypothetical protein
MPRRSAASLTVLPPRPRRHLEPPDDLTPEQAVVWRMTVQARPSDYFDQACTALLVEYCRNADRANFVAGLLKQTDPTDLDLFERLAAMANRESKLLAILAAKLRISPSSTRRAEHVIRPVQPDFQTVP